MSFHPSCCFTRYHIGDEYGIVNRDGGIPDCDSVTCTVGKLTDFDLGNDSITAYVERINLYFTANDVADGKKVAVFLSAIGPKTCALLRNLTTQVAQAEKTFAQIVELLKGH